MKYTVDGNRFVDLKGREVIFNGINIVFKGIDDSSVPGGRRYTRPFEAEDFATLKRRGINLVRFGIVWDAIEHEMGVYDDAYLDWVRSCLDQCSNNGISVFLDMHQDLYGRIFDGGAPEWATLTDGEAHIKGDLWSDAYLFSGAVNRAYRNFWENRQVPGGKGLQVHYADLWLYVIDKLGDHEAVMGYDFINEPFPGENSLEIMGSLLMTYSGLTGQNKTPQEMLAAFQDEQMKFQLLQDIDDPELYGAMADAGKPMVQAFDKGDLANFYNHMTKAVRSRTDQGLVMTENNYFSNMGIESSVQRISVDGETEPMQVYSPHGYDLVVDTPAIVMASDNRITTILDAHKRVQDRLNVPVIFGEWGAHCQYSEGLSHIEYILNYFDRNKWSHTYYCWDDGFETFPVADVLSRPYPQAVAGVIESYGYDYETRTFKMVWSEVEDFESPTVIYLPGEPKEILMDGPIELIENNGYYCLSVMYQGNGIREISVIC